MPHFGISSVKATNGSLVFSYSQLGLLLLLGAMAAPSDVEVLAKKKKSININIMVSIFPRNGRNGDNEFLQCYFCTSVLARFIISELQSLPSVSSSVWE